jgi:DNA-binding LacI/PurR family transcriptional regulator
MIEKKSKLTLADIARMANVSTSTVSRALNDNPLIKEDTRARIQALAKSNNFSLNAAASRLRTQRTNVIAVILNLDEKTEQSVSDPFLLKIVGDLNQALNARGYELLLSNSFMAQDNWVNYFINSQRADGLIVVGQGKDMTQIQQAAATGAPMVVWGDINTSADYALVGSDNFLGGEQATHHLISQGHKSILFLGDVEHSEISARYRGYCSALATHDIPLNPDLVLSIDITSQAAYTAVSEHIRQHGLNFDGIFAVSDMMAFGALKALKERYISIPNDVAIVGFDDIAMAELMHPSLSTIHQDTKTASVLMVDKMMTLLQGQVAHSSTVNIELIVRHSSQA